MKFLNSDYSKGYANFAKKQAAPYTKLADGKKFDVAVTKNPTVAKGKDLSKSQKLKTTLAAEKASVQSRMASLKSSPTSIPAKPKNIRIGSGNLLKDVKERGASVLKKAGSFASKNKVAVGLGAAGTLGVAGVAMARKMRNKKK